VRLRGAAWGLLAVAVSCFPPPLDESGRRCATDRPCGSGYVCFEGICTLPERVDAGPDNWLQNGGFERINDAGDPLFWRAMPATSGGDLTTDTAFAFEGTRSVRLFSPDGGDQPGVLVTTSNEVLGTAFGQVWCARAWARSSSDAGFPVRLFVRERSSTGTIIGENTPTNVRVATQWTLLEERYQAEGADRMDVRVQHTNRIGKQALLWVDDVRLKRSATQECSW